MRSPSLNLLLLLATLCLFTSPSEAKLFRNAYVSFELPPNWNCNLEGTEWVCVSQFSQKSKEAIIILTAKEVGPTDTFQAYMAHLKAPRVLPAGKGRAQNSKVYQVTQRQISNHPWIDGMHLGSEVSSYYTRYLATIKDRIAILVTFSAHKAHYTKYSNDFLKAIQSLRVVAAKDLLANREKVGVRSSSETLGAPIGEAMPVDIMSEDFPEEDSSLSDTSSMLLGLLIVLGALGFYFYRKTGGRLGGSKGKGKKKK